MCLFAGLAPHVDAAQPNFVVIFTDDQGYGDLSCFGGEHVSTPRIDQMAAEGSRLTSFYVAAPVCTPSRAALMTGCYPKRIDMATGSNFGVLLAGDTKGLNPDEMTIAEVLKTAGYKTGMFGKWHLGDQPEFLPTKQGFDEYFGVPYSHDIHPFHPRQNHYKFPPLPLLDNETVIEMDPDADYLTKRITEHAVSFIERNKDEPFFLYVPHPIPHAPLHVSPPFMEGVSEEIVATLKTEDGNIDYRTRDQLFRQAIAEIDWSVGQILDTLKANGLDDNTLVLFTSDNGPPRNTIFASPGPLRGNKGTTFEGGMREPTVVRWPGKIPAGKPNDELMTAMDLLPTFAKLAGAEIPADRVIDGKDIWPTLADEAETPHKAFFYHRGNALSAVRSGKWKLHVNNGKPTQLYDLENDIGEKKNLLDAHPQVVERLRGYLADFAADIANNNRPAAFVANPKPLSKSTDASVADPQEKSARPLKAIYTPAIGLDPQAGVMRRDPSDIIKVGDLYYVWYSKGKIAPGYDATVWYATSPDGHKWTEKGMALAKGEPVSWEGASVFTPNILVAEGRYWLFYTGTSRKFGKPFNPDSKIGIAVSDSPDGPWERLATNPALKNSDNPTDFDSHLVDDACLIKREGKYWFYYKGRQLGKSPAQTKLGVAIADRPQGPYVKYEGNPVIPGNHEVLVWPQGKGVAAMIGTTGPKEITRSIMYSEDGLHFSKTHTVIDVPHAAGAYRPEAFTDSGTGKRIQWGVHIGKQRGSLPFIQRFDLAEAE